MLAHLVAWLIIFSGIFPEPQPGVRVYDLTGTLSSAKHDELQRLSDEVAKTTTAEFAIVVVPSLDTLTVENYANQLFRKWGIGLREYNNGVLFLIAPKDRRTRIEVGYGLEPLLSDAVCGQILDTIVLPRFRDSKMEEGIVEGAKEIARILLRYPDAAKGIPGSAPRWIRTSHSTAMLAVLAILVGSVAFMGWCLFLRSRENYSSTAFLFASLSFIALVVGSSLFLLSSPAAKSVLPLAVPGSLAGLFALFFNVKSFWRYGPRSCKKCGTALELIDEKKDDSKLSQAQALEEQLGSVDYDVWFCPACLAVDTERYVKSFSGFSDCPKCHHRTLKEVQTVEEPATTMSSGRARVTQDCVSCLFHSSYTKVIPVVTRNRRSGFSAGGGGGGGSGFGGGSSGGGGASGSW